MLLIAAVFSLLLGTGLAIPAVADRGSDAPPSGTWQRDLFGTGGVSSVQYSTLVDGKAMKLDLTVKTPDGITYQVERDDDGEDHEDEIEILFSYGRYRAKLKVEAEWDDGRPKVKFDFEGGEGAPKPKILPTVVTTAAPGAYSWRGQLCDGRPFTIAYSIGSDGVTIAGVDGPPSRVESSKHGRRVRVYFDDVKARITISVKKDRAHEMRIDAKLGRCDGVVHPTTTTPPLPTTAPPTTDYPTTAAPTTTSTTSVTTAPPTTPAPTTTPPTTTPPTTPPQRQPKYLTYKLPIGEVVVFLDEPAALENWAVNTPGWEYFTDKKGPSEVKILFRRITDKEQAQFSVSLSGNTTTASFKSDSGGTISPAPPTESTVAPGRTNPSG